MRIRTTSYRNYKQLHYTQNPEQRHLQAIKLQRHFPKRNYIVRKSQIEKKNRLDHESFYQSKIEKLLHLNSDDCKNELPLNLTKINTKKTVQFQVFTDSAHQAELERYQGHVKLEEKYSYISAHGRLTYYLHDKNWIPHVGIKNPSYCKADTKIKDTMN